jgi:hypothetical protein
VIDSANARAPVVDSAGFECRHVERIHLPAGVRRQGDVQPAPRTGVPVWVRPRVGRWADREESRSIGGSGMTKKRMPVAERQQETGT